MRMRRITPEFFIDDTLADMQPLGRLLFVGLWCLADREGRLVDRPRRIKVQVLPYDDCDVDALLAELEQGGFIQRYEVAGNRYVQILNDYWKQQRPHSSERASEIPAPDVVNPGAPPWSTQVNHRGQPRCATVVNPGAPPWSTQVNHRRERTITPFGVASYGNSTGMPKNGGSIKQDELFQSETPVHSTSCDTKTEEPYFSSRSELLSSTEVHTHGVDSQSQPTRRNHTPQTKTSQEKNQRIEQIVKLYHEILPSLPKVKVISPARKSAFNAWLRVKKERESATVAESPFLLGDNDRRWRPNIDWLLKPSNMLKVIEGYYLKPKSNVSRVTERTIRNLSAWLAQED